MARSRSSSSSSSSSGSSDGSKKKPNWWQRMKGQKSNENASSSSALQTGGAALLIGAAQGLLKPNDDNRHQQDSATHSNETSPLLPSSNANGQTHVERSKAHVVVGTSLTALFLVVLTLMLVFEDLHDSIGPWFGAIPKDPSLAALVILQNAPVIDGHIDLPYLLRERYANNVSAVDMDGTVAGHVDIQRLRAGKVGGFFWSVYAGCPPDDETETDFLNASWRVRDTLEQIDVARGVIDKYPDVFQLALTAFDVETAIRSGRIASLLGVEGGHQLGNSLAVLRQYHALGVRYMTLTHLCHNAFADSCGFYPGMIPLHRGLSTFGVALVQEMNRLGVLVDLSHTSDDTAKQALKLSKAPVIWSHSSARAIHDVPRNVPDDVLRLVGLGEGQKDGVVMVNFAPYFVADEGKADVVAVANHVEHIAKVAGKAHVGIGSDFDGIEVVPVGLEDVSKYPALIAELFRRGWNKYELAGLTGANLLRVLKRAEKVSREIQAAGTHPKYDIYEKRTDIPRSVEEL
ncbi:dipeptidase [Coprinopsis sp. MPI-PUGE-AT-0042]|nr:dipeptidase [Coprinopsis sp. MPI-PUGE-AT-0042]